LCSTIPDSGLGQCFVLFVKKEAPVAHDTITNAFDYVIVVNETILEALVVLCFDESIQVSKVVVLKHPIVTDKVLQRFVCFVDSALKFEKPAK